MNGEFIEYVHELKATGKIRHIGMSTHNPDVAKMAALGDEVEMILFSINPAFDLLPPTDNIENYFAETYDESLNRIAPEREELYRICEERNVGITVMKGYAGGRLFDAKTSPFGVALTPIQCLHYALTRPAVASVMVGFDVPQHVAEAVAYETASAEEKDYATVLANAPKHAYAAFSQCTYCGHCAPCPVEIDIAMVNKLYDLATMHEEVPATLSTASCQCGCLSGVRRMREPMSVWRAGNREDAESQRDFQIKLMKELFRICFLFVARWNMGK